MGSNYMGSPLTPKDQSLNRTRGAGWCFAVLCFSMFINIILAFLHARGVSINATTAITAQALVTLLVVPIAFFRGFYIKPSAVIALSFIIFSALVVNFLNPLNLKSVYDAVLIPLYIILGISARYVNSRWMSYLLIFTVLIVIIEAMFPALYVSLLDPHGYLAATRDWIADHKAANSAANDGLYGGAYRSGGSRFSFADHRVGGPFLEPLSLGYFSFLISLYYTGLSRARWSIRICALFACLAMAMASDSRIPTVLIVVSACLLSFRFRLPALLIWLTFPIVLISAYLVYLGHFALLYGDTYYRIAITFDALKSVNLGQVLIGMVPLERVGDSGILYMLRAVGLLGMPVAIWFYSGAFTRRPGTNVSFFVMITIYLTVTLMFGGASLSIKTASLLGFLVGLAGYRERTRPSPTNLLAQGSGGSTQQLQTLEHLSPGPSKMHAYDNQVRRIK